MSTIDDLFDMKEEALFQKREAEWLATRIADICEDYDSTSGTLEGIADPKKRARCAQRIQRQQRDHARLMRDHAEKEKLYRDKARAKARVRETEKFAEKQARAVEENKRRMRGDDDDKRPKTKTFPMGAEIMRRFNRKTITG